MISIIIPTYNEAATIKKTINAILQNDEQNLVHEIIVADGGSTDSTLTESMSEGVTVLKNCTKGRAAQMNLGAKQATGSILYFLHADTLPPATFTTDILQVIQSGYSAGCYMLSFDYPHWFLQANCWFTRFDIDSIRFGDQSLFVTRKSFDAVGGFSEDHIVLEDQHIIKKLKSQGKFKVVKKPVITSARKYLENGIYRTQAIFFLIYFMYRLGIPQQKLITTYKKLIKQDKL